LRQERALATFNCVRPISIVPAPSRGAWPKWKIQLNRAPIRKTTSAFCSARVRAAATDSGWSSGTTPLPIGERRNGICVRSRKARTSSSARDQAMPLPTRTSGRSAFSKRFSASSMYSCGATVRGGGGGGGGGRGGGADRERRPAIRGGVGHAGGAVHGAGAGHDGAGAGAALQIAIGLRGVRGGLLVAHADIGDTLLLGGRGDR